MAATPRVVSSSGFPGLETAIQTRVGYFPGLIVPYCFSESLVGMITYNNALDEITRGNQVVKFEKMPAPTPWQEGHELNQELTYEVFEPGEDCVQICNFAHKGLKVDEIQEYFEKGRMDSFLNQWMMNARSTLGESWNRDVLLRYYQQARWKGTATGPNGNLNFGSPTSVLMIDPKVNSRTGSIGIPNFFARMKRLFDELKCKYGPGELFAVVNPAFQEAMAESPTYTNSQIAGACMPCSPLIGGKFANPIQGMEVIVSNELPVGPNGTQVAIFGWKKAQYWTGDIISNEIIQPDRHSYGRYYRMLATWGGKVVYPERIGVIHYNFTAS